MRNKKVFNRSLSLLLSLVMILSMLPMTVFGASVSMGNMTSGSTVIPGAGPGDPKWQGYGDIHGYKISVWFAPTVEYDSNDMPVYDWTALQGSSNAPFKIGKTIYMRKSKINFNGYDMPSFWSDQSIFEQVTLGEGYKKTDAEWGNTFEYYITPNLSIFGRTQDSIDNGWVNDDGSTFEGISKVYNKYYNYLAMMQERGMQDTFGYKQLFDYVSRLYDADQSWRKATGYTYSWWDLLSEEEGREKDVNDRMTPAGFILPFSEAQTGSKTSEEIKSYFLNPLVLNQISYLSYDSALNQEPWTYDDFILGQYSKKSDGTYKYPNGQYKIYIEPVIYRFFNGQAGVMSWRDAVYEYKDKNYNGGTIYASVAQFQAAEALALEDVDKSLVEKSTGKYLGYNGLSPLISSDGEAKVVGKDLHNTLGVGVLTSPSLNDYPLNGPKVVKHYVEIEKVDSNGKVTFKKAKDSVIEPINRYYFGKDGSFENIPVIQDVEEDSKGVAVLNDLFTTDKYDGVKADSSTEWTNTNLPVGMGLDLENSRVDIAGYSFGMITGSKEFLEAYLGYATIGIAQGVEGETALNVFSYYNALSEAYDEIIRVNMNLTEEEQVDIINYYLEKYSLRKSFYDNYHALMREVGVKEYVTKKQIKMGKLNFNANSWPNVNVIPPEEYVPDGDNLIASNTLVLRYLYMPKPIQSNVVEIVDSNGNHKAYKFCESSLIVNGDGSVNVSNPEFEGVEKYAEPELVNWVTNSDYPIHELVNSTLPNKSPDGKSGSSVNIPSYPITPITHNLYVYWRIIEPTPVIATDVPQWRLSKFFNAYTETAVGRAGMSLRLKTGCCSYGISNPKAWNYSVLNPTGLENWIHAFTVHSGEKPYVSKSSPSTSVNISANINAIKSTDVSGLRVANWLDKGSQTGLLNYSIQSASKGTGSSDSIYTKQSLMTLKVKNNDSYTNWYTVRSGSKPHTHYRSSISIGPSSSRVSYEYANVINKISFARYNQSSSRPALTVSPTVKNDNGYTTLKYQQDKTLNIYPEYGMLFDNDSNVESIKWMVSDQSRLVKPVIYQTLDYKVYVDSASTGTMATDSRAKTKAGSLGLGNLPVLYKGAPVNSTFKVYRDSNLNKAGIMTVKTFALDIDTNKVSYSDWGNNGYNGATLGEHNKLLSQIDTVGKATVTEKLLIDSPGYGSLDYTGGVRTSASNAYTKVDYSSQSNKVKDSSGKYTVCELKHKLIVRGGQVIGVEFQNRNTLGYTKYTMSQLKTADAALYDALVGMNLYNPSNDRTQTVLSTFEHKAGDSLTEDTYATMLASARQSVDGIATPDNAKVSTGSGWYSEDSTVLVVKEYITNYTVPSIAVSDKISLQVNGLQTPVDKNQFFSAMGKGYLYLKYDLPISTSAGNANAYFEFTTISGDGLDSYGKQGVNYLVPNVSVSDTTRAN